MIVKSERELALMREAGRIVARVHEALREAIRPGVTTLELDRIAERIIIQHNAIPSFKGFPGGGHRPEFPASICTSIDDEIVHGIPSAHRVLEEGQILSVDVGAIYQGYHGDAAFTVGVGRISAEAERLIQITEKALALAIAQCRPGKRVGDISAAIQRYVESQGYNVVREYTGHAIGRVMHEPPQVPNFGQPHRGSRLRPGVTLAIEPMVNAGTWQTRVLSDGWTVVTADGSLSAHFEHTVAVTNNEPEILTLL